MKTYKQKNEKPISEASKTRPLKLTISVRHYQILEEMSASGELGTNPTEVAKQIILFYFKEKGKFSIEK